MNNELIKINTTEDGKKLVSARELHEFLEIGTDFRKWIPRMLEYGFEENIDYIKVSQKCPSSKTGQTQVDYAISIDMGKELSMIQRTDKGKQARQYFIQCEKQLMEVSKKALLLEEIYNGGQGGILAAKQLTEIEVKEATRELTAKIEEDKPLVEFSNTILKSADNILVRELSKIAYEQGMDIGEKKLYKKLREWNYIMKDSTEPYQSAMNQGLFVVEEKHFNTVYGGSRISKTTKVTPKGQVFIIEKLRKEKQLN